MSLAERKKEKQGERKNLMAIYKQGVLGRAATARKNASPGLCKRQSRRKKRKDSGDTLLMATETTFNGATVMQVLEVIAG